MFVTADDYDVPPFVLMNLKDVGNEGSTGEPYQAFVSFINEQEEIALRELLGHTLYEAFVAFLGTLTDYDLDTATTVNSLYAKGNDVWKALISTTNTPPAVGANWVLVEENNRWLLLKNGSDYQNQNEKPRKWKGMKAMLKPLLYGLWIGTDQSRATGVGVVVNDNENSSVVNAGQEITKGQNMFMVVAGRNEYEQNSLYQYLFLSEDVYLDAVQAIEDVDDIKQYIVENFCPPEFQNEFDL